MSGSESYVAVGEEREARLRLVEGAGNRVNKDT